MIQLPLPNVPTRSQCGKKFDTQHAMSCKKEGFVTLRYNKLRYITGALLEEVYHNVTIKPIMQPVADNNLVP